MTFTIEVHFDNADQLTDPHLAFWFPGGGDPTVVAAMGSDGFGAVYQITVNRRRFQFMFKEGPGLSGRWEQFGLMRQFRPLEESGSALKPSEIWCKGDRAFVYHVEPRAPETETAEQFLSDLDFKPGAFVTNTGAVSALGATPLADGRWVFGLYHPNAARVYLMGSFNDWQRPGHGQPDSTKFIEMKFYRGYFGTPNTWLVVTDKASADDEYKFFIQGGVPHDHKNRPWRLTIDPFARRLATDFQFNNPVVVDPTSFSWSDDEWTTPNPNQLILYEMSVYGFTEGDPDITPENRGTFRGVTERIEQGYFDRLGVTALSLMPLAEFSSTQSPSTLGYNSSVFPAIERDFGTPDDLRALVNTAHRNNLAVIIDKVFNHTDNSFNPMWQMILEHPGEEDSGEGGLYFNGVTPWGNRVATEKKDVQNLLIDTCKLYITEYHVDGFRFDATHANYMDHGFLHRLIQELQRLKPDVVMIAENLPNQSDLNRQGFDGYAQWCNQFHDKIKALLREGPFEGENFNAEHLGDMFYFSKSNFAAHTNNVINYCESHDEHSVAHEVSFTSSLNHPAAKERKGRLGLMASAVALGQPMIYMGQEFNTDRPRNVVTVQWPANLEQNGFFQWCSRLLRIRRRYAGLKLEGFDPVSEGHFVFVLGPWLDNRHGGGKRVIGWRSRPTSSVFDTIVVMLNFENHGVLVDVEFDIPGVWVKLADIDRVNDLPPDGTNSIEDPTALNTGDGRFNNFLLPSSSGYVYTLASG
jgi:1,4-alpha-glucan branching enzyme